MPIKLTVCHCECCVKSVTLIHEMSTHVPHGRNYFYIQYVKINQVTAITYYQEIENENLIGYIFLD